MKHIAVIAGNVRQFWLYIQENHPEAECHMEGMARTKREEYHFVDSPDKAYGFIFSEVITVGSGDRLVNYTETLFIARRYLGSERSSCKANTQNS